MGLMWEPMSFSTSVQLRRNPGLAALLLCLCAAPATSRETIDLSLKSESGVDARCAFVRTFEEGSWSSPEGIARILSFSSGKGMFYPTAHLASYYADLPALVEALFADPSPAAKQMAAATVAFAQLGDYLEREMQAALSREGNGEAGSSESAEGGEKAPAKKAKRVKKGAASKVLAKLFEDKSAATLELAVLAAAYAGNASVRALVEAAPAKAGSGMTGAKLLYHARLGDPLDAAQVAAAFALSANAAEHLTTAGPMLANFNLLQPREAYACEALGIAKAEGQLDPLCRMLVHPDIRVQIEAIRALRKIGSREALPRLLKRLDTREWPVLAELCLALAALPAKESVAPLIARLKRETGRLRLDVNYALSCIAGDQIADSATEWQAWWNKASGKFQVDEERTRSFRGSHRIQDMRVPPLGSFYGLPICSDHFAYVVDSSNSMKGAKMENLRSNLKDSINGLAPGVCFGIVDFGGTVESMNQNRLTDSKRTGLDRLQKIRLSQGTRLYDALEEAAWMEGVDTLFVLTDGAPVKGQLNRWPQLYRAIALMNRYRPLAMHTVAFEARTANQQSLREMAGQTYGLTIEVN